MIKHHLSRWGANAGPTASGRPGLALVPRTLRSVRFLEAGVSQDRNESSDRFAILAIRDLSSFICHVFQMKNDEWQITHNKSSDTHKKNKLVAGDVQEAGRNLRVFALAAGNARKTLAKPAAAAVPLTHSAEIDSLLQFMFRRALPKAT